MMLRIKFEYKDAYTNGEWSKQECRMSSLEACKKVYGLGIDCDYRIIEVIDEDDENANRKKVL